MPAPLVAAPLVFAKVVGAAITVNVASEDQKGEIMAIVFNIRSEDVKEMEQGLKGLDKNFIEINCKKTLKIKEVGR
ncbi:MAG: hypothetical protein LBC85_10775 [Fibromonadaceae bacterium]|jgi:hypothetical protein|nr:hypothetical protein [Fibromonadaceae bacterium]